MKTIYIKCVLHDLENFYLLNPIPKFFEKVHLRIPLSSLGKFIGDVMHSRNYFVTISISRIQKWSLTAVL